MVRETSMQCYDEIKNSGVLSKMLLATYKAIAENDNISENLGVCQLEIIEKTGLRHECITPIPARLVKMGLIFETGKKKYKGRKRICYGITGETKPFKRSVLPKANWKDKYFDAIKKIDELEQEVERLSVRKRIIKNCGASKLRLGKVNKSRFEQMKLF